MTKIILPTQAAVEAALRIVDGRKARVVAGVLRNAGAGGSYFQPLDDGVGAHRPQNIDSVSLSGSGASTVIRVDYASLDVQRVATFIAQPDEVYSLNGISCGCSVGIDHTDIYVYQARNLSDEYHYNGSTWVFSNGSPYAPFVFSSFTSGVLRLTHADVGSGGNNITLTPVGTTYRPVVNGTVNGTEMNISFVDAAGNVVTTPDTNMKVHITRPMWRPVQVDPRPLQGGVYTNSNIWLLGVFEV